VHVALVGRGAVQRLRAEDAVAGLLEDGGLPAHVQAQAAVGGRDVRGEEAGATRCGLQLGSEGVVEPVAGTVARLGRDDHVAHERGGALGEVGHRGRRGEVDHARGARRRYTALGWV
jgi:hypothetical protein